ncbi:MAG: hypothetical protein ICV66_01215 [Chitinophagaceae bacterium]|nr:hypothetical protein [Chitinophagaceae bacterium]
MKLELNEWHDFSSLYYMSSNKKDVPEQYTGSESNTEDSVTFNNEKQAKEFFRIVKNRLLYVNSWNQISGAASAKFCLTDKTGNYVNRSVTEGDHFEINIPAPGSVTGDGRDWVQVESVEENHNNSEESVTIKVHPATNPRNKKSDVAHFFSEEASSSFIVKRKNNTITAGVYGRNEKPNTDAKSVIDKARNTAIAAGAIGGFSKLQWKNLLKGLLKQDDKK